MLGNAVITYIFLILCDINIHLGTQLSVFCISFFILLCLVLNMFKQSASNYRRINVQPPCYGSVEMRPAFPNTCQKPPTSSCFTRKRYLGKRLYVSLASPIRPEDANFVNQHRVNQAGNRDAHFVNQHRVNQAENSDANFVKQHRIVKQVEKSYAHVINQHRINQAENRYSQFNNQRRINEAENSDDNFVHQHRINQAKNSDANFVNKRRMNRAKNSDDNFVNQHRINLAENYYENFFNQLRIDQAENSYANVVNQRRINQAENSGDNFVNQHRVDHAENSDAHFDNQCRIYQAENDDNLVNKNRIHLAENYYENFVNQLRIDQAENDDNLVNKHRVHQAENSDDRFVNQHRIKQAENKYSNFVNQHKNNQAENSDDNFVNQCRTNQTENSDDNFVNQCRTNQAENSGDNFFNQLRVDQAETVLYSESTGQHSLVETHMQSNEHCPKHCCLDDSRPNSRSYDLVQTSVTRFVSVEAKLMQIKGAEQLPKSRFHSEAETNFISDMDSTAYFEQEMYSSSSESSEFISPFPSDTSNILYKNTKTKSLAEEGSTKLLAIAHKNDQKLSDELGVSTKSRLRFNKQSQAGENIGDNSGHTKTCNESHCKVTADVVKPHSTSPHSTSCLIRDTCVQKYTSPKSRPSSKLETLQQKILKSMEMKIKQWKDSAKVNQENIAHKAAKVHAGSDPLQQISVNTSSEQRQWKTSDKSNKFQYKLGNTCSVSLNQNVTRMQANKENTKSKNKKILTSHCRQAAMSKYCRYSPIKHQDEKTLSGLSSLKSVSKLSAKSKEVSLQLGTDSSRSFFMEEKSQIPFTSSYSSSHNTPQLTYPKPTPPRCKCCNEISTIKSPSADDKVNHTQAAKTSKLKNISKIYLTKRTKYRNAMTSPLVTRPSRKSQSSNGRLQLLDKKVMTSPALSSTLTQAVSSVSSEPFPPRRFTSLDLGKIEQQRLCKAGIGPGDLSCNIALEACPSLVIQLTNSPLTKSLQSHRANQESNTPTSEWSFELSCEIENE